MDTSHMGSVMHPGSFNHGSLNVDKMSDFEMRSSYADEVALSHPGCFPQLQQVPTLAWVGSSRLTLSSSPHIPLLTGQDSHGTLTATR